MNRDEEEIVAIRISKTLKGLCPFFYKHGQGEVEWHKCGCKASGSSCTCVWNIQDSCVAGTWDKLSFVNEHNNKKQAEQRKALAEAVKAANNSSDEPPLERTQILDIPNEV